MTTSASADLQATADRVHPPSSPDHRAVCSALRALPVLESVSDASVEILARTSRLGRYRSGDHVYWRGDAGHSIHVVAAGRVRLYLSTEAGNEVTLGEVGRGDFYGELSLFTGSRSVNVQALTDLTTVEIPSDAITAMVRSQPETAIDLMRDLCARRRAALERVADMALLDVHRRTVQVLRREAERQPASPPIVRLEMSQEQLAKSIGTSRETLNRTLALLARAGIVTASSRGEIVVDRDMLRRTARSPYGD